MNIRTFTGALLLALPLVAQAGPQATQTWINGRPVSIHTAQTAAAPASCEHAVEQQLAREGWYDAIYRAVGPDQAYLIVSQRSAEPCEAKSVKIMLWRAVVQKGATVTETREYTLKPSEVNAFLDSELRPLAAQFTTSAGGQS